MSYKVLLIPGDGIGPEIIHEAQKVLDSVAKINGGAVEYTQGLLGGAQSMRQVFPCMKRLWQRHETVKQFC